MSDTQTDDWTEEKCIKLIREYRARPMLWDPKNSLYFKKTMKASAWDEIANLMKVDPETCKRKMMVLMSSFRREKAKLIHSLSKQSDGPIRKYTSTWFAFKEMVFMLDKDMERKRRLNGIPEDDEEFPNIKMTLLKRHIQPPIRTDMKRPTIEYKRQTLTPCKTARLPVRAETTTLEAIPSSSQTLTDRDEEIKFFTSFIGNKMKNYTDVTKNAVQQAICDVIFKADQNYYESNTNKYTIINTEPLENISFDADHAVQIKQQPLSDSE